MSGIFDVISSVLGAGASAAGQSLSGVKPSSSTTASNTSKNIAGAVNELTNAGSAGTTTVANRPNLMPNGNLMPDATNSPIAPVATASYGDADLGSSPQDYRGMKIAPQTPVQSKELSVDPAVKLQAAQNAAFAKMDEAQAHHANVKNAELVAYQQAMADAKNSLLKTHGTSHENPNASWQQHAGVGGNFIVDPQGGTYYVPDKGGRALEVLTGPNGMPGHRLANVANGFTSGGGVENYDVSPQPKVEQGQEVVSPVVETAPQAQGVVADADLQEPKGDAHWTLREEPSFLLAKNQRTGELGKVHVDPLSTNEKQEALAPHGAGPLDANSPKRIRAQLADMDIGNGAGNVTELFHSLQLDKQRILENKLQAALDKQFKGKK